MAHTPPTKYSKAVKKTLRWLVADEWIASPLDATGEAQYLLCHAKRLHESLRRLPAAPSEKGRCLVVGSWGLEVPYLQGHLGWKDVTCVCAPRRYSGRITRQSRRHPNTAESYDFDLLEQDIEVGSLPFESQSFDLVVFWGCFEHLRHDPEFSLYEINRLCVPGGMVSLVTDNAISFQSTHKLICGFPMPMRLHCPEPEGHWRLYTPPEIAELLEGTGWRVDLLTSIVPDPVVYWKRWKRWMFKKLIADLRRGFGLAEPYWNAFVLAHAIKDASPTRCYPTWLYKDEKIRQLKIEMMELVSREPSVAVPA